MYGDCAEPTAGTAINSRQVLQAGKRPVDIFPQKYDSERTVYAPRGLIAMLGGAMRLHFRGDHPDRRLFMETLRARCDHTRH